jgi:hypothetical protein
VRKSRSTTERKLPYLYVDRAASACDKLEESLCREEQLSHYNGNEKA